MRFLFATLLAAIVAAGCVTRSGARKEAQRTAFEEKQREEWEKLNKEPAIWFRGDIRNPRVAWKEGITLAEALAEAHYTWNWDPQLLTVTRNGQVYPINVRRLLRGQENPELEPGDIVDVKH